LALVPFDLENAPRVDRQVEAPKKKVKKETPAAAEASASSAPSEPAAEQKLEKKDKKEKPKKETAAGAPPAAKPAKGASAPPAASDDSGEPSPSMIDLRVGHIVASKSEAKSEAYKLLISILQSKNIPMLMGFMLR
jgi:aminoacyl tRNA synthase complex-interacting multifunctional protein 1